MGSELLVVLDASPDAEEWLGSVATIRQSISSRVHIVEAASSTSLASHPQVLAAVDGDLPTGLLSSLTAEESLFVRAWAARQREKTRPGEGLDWDAQGFRAP